MSEKQPKYGYSIEIHIDDLHIFNDCPRCAYFEYHPNMNIQRPGKSKEHKDFLFLYVHPEKVKVYSDNKKRNSDPVEYSIEILHSNYERIEEMKEDITYAVNILKQRDFPLQDKDCEYCNYYEKLFDMIA